MVKEALLYALLDLDFLVSVDAAKARLKDMVCMVVRLETTDFRFGCLPFRVAFRGRAVIGVGGVVIGKMGTGQGGR